MSQIASDDFNPAALSATPKLDGFGFLGRLVVFLILLGATAYGGYSIYIDATAAGVLSLAALPFVLLFLALLIALGFEFVNGFHDTANAVATVIYTHSLTAPQAVIWSGLWNFLGVLTSSGAVAFGIVSLLPVELILKVGSNAGFAMVFALLIAAIVWNVGTWLFGLPSSSSHTLIGSIIGVGVANAMMHGKNGTAGVDWSKAEEIGKALLISPMVGFVAAALLLMAMKLLVRNRALYEAPKSDAPPPLWIRALLIFTCTGVSFVHGSNDGQKGMGLIMLILIGIVPQAYALNRAVPETYEPQFHQQSQQLVAALTPANAAPAGDSIAARTELQRYIADKSYAPATLPALVALSQDIDLQVTKYGSLQLVPGAQTNNMRNDMYVAAEAIKRLLKEPSLGWSDPQKTALESYQKSLNEATRFIPTWVKVLVAIALGLGTMVGWRRIVVTVGEKIGKSHLTYAQGAVAEMVTMGTIGAADVVGLPVSTTHVLSSGVAGAMAGNGSGLQMDTVRNLAVAWILTLPASMALAGGLYWLFTQFLP